MEKCPSPTYPYEGKSPLTNATTATETRSSKVKCKSHRELALRGGLFAKGALGGTNCNRQPECPDRAGEMNKKGTRGTSAHRRPLECPSKNMCGVSHGIRAHASFDILPKCEVATAGFEHTKASPSAPIELAKRRRPAQITAHDREATRATPHAYLN